MIVDFWHASLAATLQQRFKIKFREAEGARSEKMLASWCEALGDRDALSSRPRSLGGLLYDSAGPRQSGGSTRRPIYERRRRPAQLRPGQAGAANLSAREKGHVSKEHAAWKQKITKLQSELRATEGQLQVALDARAH